ncbi:protein lifeguard 1 [Trichonephila clavata]|uniref:Protein lifeguard 1 n=2 Tax=Trichonephila clavata TaxID=2740835 RepID=A0A8X6GF42_TRICU|nr:protein lifeguard 1 [Trichonephila clavata]
MGKEPKENKKKQKEKGDKDEKEEETSEDDKDKKKEETSEDGKDKEKEETSEDDKDENEKEAKKDDEKQKEKETESKTDTQQEEYQQMPHPYGYQGSIPQYPPNPQGTPGYHYTPPYGQAAYGHSQRSDYGPIRPGSRRTPWQTGPMPGYTGFSDVEVRKIFVRKVYMILTLQLLFTIGIVCVFIFEPHVRNYVRGSSYMHYLSLAVFIGVYLGLVCSENLRRKFPTNIILLSIFTLATSVLMGTLSSFFKTNTIIIAIGVCAVVCFTVIPFSFFTKFDFTTCGGMLCILLLILFLFGIIAIFVREHAMTMIYAGFGAIVFIMYLAYDTQMLMGGRHVEINPEEYIFAAIHIYIDVVYIFMFLLMLVGGAQD